MVSLSQATRVSSHDHRLRFANGARPCSSTRSRLFPLHAQFGVSALCCCVLTVMLLGCADRSATTEAARLQLSVGALREATNERKDQPLDALRKLSCSHADVCAARDACVDAFSHHVRGITLGGNIRHRLDSDAGIEAMADMAALQQQLLEMNLEIEEGRERMPLCDSRMTELRLQYKL